MIIAIVKISATNCVTEMLLAVQRAGMETFECCLQDASVALPACDGFIIAGEFSSALRASQRERVARIIAFHPYMVLIKAAAEEGKPVLGIGAGAHILVAAGLVPQLENHQLALALSRRPLPVAEVHRAHPHHNPHAQKQAQQPDANTACKSACAEQWIHARLAENYQRNAFTQYLTLQSILTLPVLEQDADCFVISAALWQEIEHNGLAVLEYCTAEGHPARAEQNAVNYPHCHYIAALSNKAGNVLAMVAHPERAPSGDMIFSSMREFILAQHFVQVAPLNYVLRREIFARAPIHQFDETRYFAALSECSVASNIAKEVSAILQTLNYAVTLKHYVYTLSLCAQHALLKDNDAALSAEDCAVRDLHAQLEKIAEVELKPPPLNTGTNRASAALLLVLQKDAVQQSGFSVAQEARVVADLWQISSETQAIDEIMDAILATHLLHNPALEKIYRIAPSALRNANKCE